jgi:hypothetical protein
MRSASCGSPFHRRGRIQSRTIRSYRHGKGSSAVLFVTLDLQISIHECVWIFDRVKDTAASCLDWHFRVCGYSRWSTERCCERNPHQV